MRRANVGESQYSQYGGQQTEVLEEENRELEQGLSDKVKALKTLSIDIGHEVREQNNFLRTMDDDFEKSSGFLGATMKRVQIMARSGHNRYIFYLILFCLCVFFVCWIIIKTR